MFEIALAVGGNGNAEGGRALFENIVKRFGASADPGFEDVVYKSCHQILSTLGGATREPSVFEQYLRGSSAPHAQTMLEILQYSIREVEHRHDEAIEVLRQFYKSETPFALYLRNFDKGAVFEEFSIEDSDLALPVAAWGDEPVERLLANTLAVRIPLIGVVNSEDIRPRASSDVLPKLHVSSHMWQSVVLALIYVSSAIIVDIDELTVSIDSELSMIKSLNRQGACVVVLSTRDDLLAVAQKAFKGTHNLSDPMLQLPTISKDAAQLSEFEHTFWIDELKTNTLEEVPVLRYLIEEFELRRMGAASANGPSATKQEGDITAG